MTLLVLFVFLAIGVSFLCSILEAVLLSITPSFVEAAEEEQPKLAGKLRELRKDIERPLSAILSLNTIAHTIGATGAGAQAAVVFDDFGVGVFSAILTLGILILSEIIPKTLGATYWRSLASFTVKTLPILILVQLPLVWMSQAITGFLKRGKSASEVSREEIAAMASAGQRLGIVGADETLVVNNLFQLPHIPVNEVMTPRTVIEHVSGEEKISAVIEGKDTFPFSRLLVTGETVDDVSGFALTRDLLLAAVNGQKSKKVKEFVRELPRVAEDQDLDSLLDLLMERDAHIALVQDQYGGTAGLVTMEDVLETLLGNEIVDELDEAVDLQDVAKTQAKERREKRKNNK